MTVPASDSPPLFLVLCRPPEDEWKILPGYVEALNRKGCEVFAVPKNLAMDVPLAEILKICPRPPAAILQLITARPLLPDGLATSTAPTICLHPDTYAFTERRIRWSFLFDHAAVYHPGYDTRFREGGHPSVFVSPFAVRQQSFDQPEAERVYEVGWVGQSSGVIYRNRTRLLPVLAQHFRMNDWAKSYSLDETAGIYRSSKIVLNIGRDDYPQDANMRVFEVLASGALLITALPSELAQLGFVEGTHFIGYTKDEEIVPLIRSFLNNEQARARIATAAREKILSEHTYDHRVQQILNRLKEFGEKRPAPARKWSDARGRLVALDFFVGHNVLDAAFRQYFKLFARDLRGTVEGALLLARALAAKCFRSLRRAGG